MARPAHLAALVACAALIVGCGGDGDGDKAGTSAAAPKPAATAADFPTAAGKQLNDLASLPDGPIFAPSVSVLKVGANRVGFALFDRARKQLTGAAAAVYTARPDGSDLRGPYLAREESMAVKPQFASRTVASDPDAAKSLYVARVPMPRTGKRVLTAVAKMSGRLRRTTAFGLGVSRRGGPPDVGERAIRIDTPTRADVGGDLSKIDTRDPPAPDLHAVSFADVLGRKPAVLVFATPRLCQSRVCGPVVDVAEQVRSEVGDRVAFIHMEVFRDNDVSKGYRPQFVAWHLPTEPWTFVIGSDGRVKQRFEGAFSADELRRAVDEVS